MPIIELNLPQGTFDQPTYQQLLNKLSKAILVCDVTRNNPAAEAINWCYVREHPTGMSLIGGQPEQKPHYHIQLTTLAGAMTAKDKQTIVENMTQIILESEQSPYNQLNAGRVWITFNEILDGNWGGGGQIYRLEKLREYLKGST